jgi:hypothetical protein
MNERAEPILSTADDPSTSQSIESLIESQDIESEHEYLNPLTMLLFHRAFCE